MTDETKRNNILKFFSNPTVGILGSIASLVGLVLAIIFFISSQKSPELVYSIHPSKNILASSNRPSDLAVLYKGSPVQGKDVIAVTISIWNRGNESIKQGSILENVNIKFSPEVNVLEASITKLSRSVIELKTINDEESFRKGIVPLKWDILENGDGGNLQVIYSGSQGAEITMTGIIEGQGKPKELSTISLNQQPESSVFNDVKVSKWVLPGIIIFSVVITGFIIPNFRKFDIYPFNSERYREGSTIWVIFVVAITPFLGAAIYLFLKLDEWYPPFGF